MAELPPEPLEYRGAGSGGPGDGPSPKALFLYGLLAGSLVSGAVWPWWWHLANANNPPNGNWMMLLVAIPATKVLIAIVCFFYPRWRALSAGLLTSIAVGFLIFFGLCAINVLKGI